MNDLAMKPADLGALRACASGAAAAGDRPYFLCAPAGALAATEARRLADWLRQLPCPTLCIAHPDASRALVRAADVVVKTLDEAQPLLAGIRRTPVAASVFAQLLRSTEKLPVL